MKRFLCGVMAVGVIIGLVSRGRTGHNVTGRIAASHLRDKAKADVAALLGG